MTDNLTGGYLLYGGGVRWDKQKIQEYIMDGIKKVDKACEKKKGRKEEKSKIRKVKKQKGGYNSELSCVTNAANVLANTFTNLNVVPNISIQPSEAGYNIIDNHLSSHMGIIPRSFNLEGNYEPPLQGGCGCSAGSPIP